MADEPTTPRGKEKSVNASHHDLVGEMIEGRSINNPRPINLTPYEGEPIPGGPPPDPGSSNSADATPSPDSSSPQQSGSHDTPAE